ncbi:MAG: Dark-response protein 21 [Candidatus Accumulibacter adjunctus]|uniref:Ribosome hibernation promoting factor n=1 Tax=Candidatus Accumulibacter adjunctus TaxID=1454001 RepID=A0A011MRD8_9PROT|nr:MAG: Dark-response protein 21 [Candidatus Accumulibacter adjunctus]
MNLQIQSHDFALTEGLRQHVETRLACALNHGQEVVTRIVVRLADVNGPRGGEDKSCSIEVRIKGAPALVVEDTQSDLYVAVDRASGRIGRTLDRYLARRREAAMPAASQQPSPAEERP